MFKKHEKEFHPVIEEYICAYSEQRLHKVDKQAFRRLAASNSEVRRIAISAKKGRLMLRSVFQEVGEG